MRYRSHRIIQLCSKFGYSRQSTPFFSVCRENVTTDSQYPAYKVGEYSDTSVTVVFACLMPFELAIKRNKSKKATCPSCCCLLWVHILQCITCASLTKGSEGKQMPFPTTENERWDETAFLQQHEHDWILFPSTSPLFYWLNCMCVGAVNQ